MTASTSVVYPVIRVPGHGERPVCAKRDGPTEKGRPAGIMAGVHYVRTAGPKSVPMITPELWAPVIRRCVFAERSSLLSSIGQLFDGRGPSRADDVDTLGEFRRSIISAWNLLEQPRWPVDLTLNRISFTFRILDETGSPVKVISVDRLQQALRTASFASSEDINDGSASFEQRWQPEKRPFVTVYENIEGYEALILPTDDDRYVRPTLWRVTASGMGGDVVGFPEDNPWVKEAVEQRGSRRWPSAERFSPLFQAQHVAQHVAFVARLAEVFPDAASAEIAVDYLGLSGRVIGDPRPGIHYSLERRSTVNDRVATASARSDVLIPDIDEVTAELISPITRLFDGWELNADAIENLLSK